MGFIKGIHHVSMKCCGKDEYEKVLHFYRNVLGLTEIRSWDTGIMLDSGNGLIEIFTDGEERLAKGVIRHFAFAVTDVDACAKAVKEAGYQVFIEPRDIEMASKPVFQARIAFCVGPLGEEIEFFKER
ncbi:MAG: VOC family protein [bacterium]|nr:VOC family protein [bacterium]